MTKRNGTTNRASVPVVPPEDVEEVIPPRNRRSKPLDDADMPELPPPQNVDGQGIELGNDGFVPPDVPAVFGAESFKNLEPPYKTIFIPQVSEQTLATKEGRLKVIMDLVQRANIPNDDKDWVSMKCALAVKVGLPGVWDEITTYLLCTMGLEGLRVKQFMDVAKGVQVTSDPQSQEDGQMPPMMIR